MIDLTFSWPFANTPASASQFWGVVMIVQAVLVFVLLGGFFLFDVFPYLRRGPAKELAFGLSFVFVALTVGTNMFEHGLYVRDMSLSPTGPRPLDMIACLGVFTPLLTFGWQRVKNLRGLPYQYWTGPRIASVLMSAAAFAAVFFTRFVDATRFLSYELAWRDGVVMNALIGLLYLIVSGLWLRFQWSQRRRSPVGWNAIGAALGLVFFQFAFTRFASALLLSAGVYVDNGHNVLYLSTDIVCLIAVSVFLGIALMMLSGTRNDNSSDDVEMI